MIPELKYPKETVEQLKALFPNDQGFANALDSNSPSGWDMTSAKLKELSDLFYQLSMAGFPGGRD